jgi:hydroxymethylpyrimidine/phosphomethylpyrimidine kinase
VAARLGARGAIPLVVDPVIAASDGAPLLDAAGVESLRTRLLPLATLVTPNLAEAAALTGRTVDGPAAMADAARALVGLGARAALVTGGHLEGDAVDVLYDGRAVRELRAPRIPGPPVHGTGCALATAIAARLACGAALADAVGDAKAFVARAIAAAMPLGHGARILDVAAAAAQDGERAAAASGSGTRRSVTG